jgi:hypothetical protein
VPSFNRTLLLASTAAASTAAWAFSSLSRFSVIVVLVAEVGVGLPLEGGELVRDVGQVSGDVPDGVCVVPGPGVLVLAHPLRILGGRRIL